MTTLERIDSSIIFQTEEDWTIKQCVEHCVKEKISLRLANLRLADLYSANLSLADLYSANLSLADLYLANLYSANLYSANLSSANLSSANLSSANLRLANLSSANLSSADLYLANLSSANLSSANLRLANLSSADLSSANLSQIQLSWTSHELISEILFRQAKTIEQRKLAGLIKISIDWCWNDFLKIDDPEKNWALQILSKYKGYESYFRI